MALRIDLVLFNIFRYLDNASLFECKLVDSFWWNFINEYKDELFTSLSWIKFNKQLLESNLQQSTKGDQTWIGVCIMTGYKISYTLNDNELSFKFVSFYPEKVTKSTSVIHHQNVFLAQNYRFIYLPTELCNDYKKRRLLMYDVCHKNDQKTFHLFDYTNLNNTSSFQTKSDSIEDVLSAIPGLKNTQKINSVPDLYKIESNHFLIHRKNILVEFHKLIDINWPLIHQHVSYFFFYDRLLNFGRFLSTIVDRNQLKIIDLSSSNEFYMLIDLIPMHPYSYLIRSIELSKTHLLFLLGRSFESGGAMYTFYYVFVDVQRKTFNFDQRTGNQESFMWTSTTVQHSQILSRIYNINVFNKPRTIDVDLMNLKFIE